MLQNNSCKKLPGLLTCMITCQNFKCNKIKETSMLLLTVIWYLNGAYVGNDLLDCALIVHDVGNVTIALLSSVIDYWGWLPNVRHGLCEAFMLDFWLYGGWSLLMKVTFRFVTYILMNGCLLLYSNMKRSGMNMIHYEGCLGQLSDAVTDKLRHLCHISGTFWSLIYVCDGSMH